MRLKSFIAINVPEAMKLVRDQLGPDAVIVSTQRDEVDGKVKITAALEDTPLDALDPARPLPALDSIDELSEGLNYHRIPAGLADRLLSTAAHLAGSDQLCALAGALDAVLAFAPPPEAQTDRPLMLIGPPGAGKTATAAKLCARARLAGRHSTLITMDTVKTGGLAQVSTFAEALGAGLGQAPDTATLQELVRDCPKRNLVVIDTVGSNPLDTAEGKRLAEAAEAVGADPVLVLAAGGDVLEAAECAVAFAEAGARRLVATKLDTARRLGGVLSAADAGRLALTAVGVSPNIGDGLLPINPVSLARLILPGAARDITPAPLATSIQR
jgi:flagellar biosynthesis protein FlhF